MKINGRFSYDRSSQRDLEFFTEIREIDLHRRIFVGDESELQSYKQSVRRPVLAADSANDGLTQYGSD